jgi:hypothetical protein
VGLFLSRYVPEFRFLIRWACGVNAVALLAIAYLWVHTVKTQVEKDRRLVAVSKF